MQNNIFFKILGFVAIIGVFSGCAIKTAQNISGNNPRKLDYVDVANKQNCKVFFNFGGDYDESQKAQIAKDYATIWDGECKDGYADGLGAEISKYGDVYIAVYKDKVPHYIYEKKSYDADKFFIGEFGDIYDAELFDGRYGFIVHKNDEVEIKFAVPNDEIEATAPQNQSILARKYVKFTIEKYQKSLETLKIYKDKICNTDCTTKNGCIYYYIEENGYGGEEFDYFNLCKKETKIDFSKEIADIEKQLDETTFSIIIH